jgi:F-type H+-transporting ATPase subunit a
MISHGAFGIKIAGGGSLVMGFVMTVFEILVQVLQAYIFTLLAALYIAGAVADEH